MIDYLWAGKPAHFSIYEVGKLMNELFSNMDAQYGEDFNRLDNLDAVRSFIEANLHD